ncbi:uncharacterized protein qrfp [Hippoglossus hippoglossus]|uniref:uncharacterized protein qrfp n=1 Tax=Hippoglossus hippoglossus TaxID=8267 RepID=UPI00148CA2A6|nr:uncharacterized protein qrfp [Hippoglossus hippoglossus]
MEMSFSPSSSSPTLKHMRPSFHLGASQLTLLFLALLCPIPWTAWSCPLSFADTMDGSDLESVLQHQAALDQLVAPQLVHQALLEPGQEAEEDGSWEEEALLRAQRGDLMARPLPPFPEGHSLESYHYQDGGEGEEGGKRNEALTSIIGGLQAVNREKGGFGFRFGRKRWTDRGWRDEGRGSSEEDKRD